MRHKILWGFEKQTDQLISARWPDLKIVNSKRELAIPDDLRIKQKESKKRDKYLDLARELKNYGTWK